MAICRFSPVSDVFVSVTDGRFECCACRLNERETYETRFQQDMVEHLEEHKAAGHKVPPEAISGLSYRPKL